MEFDIAYAALLTALATVITALATAILAYYNKNLLNRIDMQRDTDMFFRSYTHRLESYKELKEHYNTNFGGKRMRAALNEIKVFFPDEGSTHHIFQSIKSVDTKFDNFDENESAYNKASLGNPGDVALEPYKSRLQESAQLLMIEYKKLISDIESFLKLNK